MKNKDKSIKISGREANAILYGFDKFFDTDPQGKIHNKPYFISLTKKEIQELRDKLFAIHSHE